MQYQPVDIPSEQRIYAAAWEVRKVWEKYFTIREQRLALLPATPNDKKYLRIVKQEEEAWDELMKKIDALKKTKERKQGGS